MSAPSTQAAERTLLARVRTAVAVVLTSAIVARAALDVRPAAALVCLAVAVAAVVTVRIRPPLSALVLTVAVVALAAVGVLTAVR
ncbi:DUF202 domain-containing protein [Tsukamurella paurometabola]|uniref:Uncharacterized protein n=1 Tax=Tsukamurella paurometabola TaxID=2061 RepID=A0ABS5NH20_TSUPA|nr:DUF202 domain-containing protein [Tsukamurella paurometabola]MBS4103218.1 hypothetical protein [Tsukamurella paurometabola]